MKPLAKMIRGKNRQKAIRRLKQEGNFDSSFLADPSIQKIEGHKTWTDNDIISLLERVDAGYIPATEEYCILQKHTSLSLAGLQFSDLPNSIDLLVNLRNMDLRYTQITVLPESIGKLSNLRKLSFSFNPITTLPESIGNLSKLEELDLNCTKITTLPESIGNLSKLVKLDLNCTQITTLPESIGQLTNLHALNLCETNITTLPDSMEQLPNLEILFLSGMKSLQTLPDWLGLLPALRRVELNDLKIPAIPKSLALRGIPFVERTHDPFRTAFEKYCGSYESIVNLNGVILTEQDKSIFLEHSDLIPGLYQSEVLQSVRECRVIFLGDGASGKSYTIKRFKNKGRKESESEPYVTSETPGVEILDYQAEMDGASFTVHFWDFGGQQLLHSMHRCFLSEDSCYVVTVKTRETKANERARYWLRNVTAFAPKSPILLLVNCWEDDNGLRSVDEPLLRKDYPNIKKVVYCSAKRAEDSEFREKLIEPLLKIAASTEGVTKRVPNQWVKTRKAIERESEEHNYLDKAQYHIICAENDIQDELAPSLLSFFLVIGFNQQNTRYRLMCLLWDIGHGILGA